MNILLLSYSDYDYDGRLRELIKVFDELGELFLFIKASKTRFDSDKIKLFTGKKFIDFIKEAKKVSKSIGNIDMLVVDNRRASVAALKVLKVVKPRWVIQDCRELYLPKETKHFVGKVGCYFERKLIKKADIVIAANSERAEFMDGYYTLKNKALSFENLRKLEYSSSFNEQSTKNKLSKYLFDDEYRIISTSGCIVSRLNDIIVKNLPKVEKKVRLLLVGENSHPDVDVIMDLIKKYNISNVDIIGKLNQDELKYLINHCHIGIVNYNQNDFNNKFCASGKLYEFVYEGIPVVTTSNPPLKKLCDEYNIGYADDKFYVGINKVLDNYDYYKSNAIAFGKQHTVAENNKKLKNEIERLIDK